LDFVTILMVSIGVAMDAFAVSLGVGTTQGRVSRRGKLRLAFHFGIFQSLMTGLGWLAGSTIASLINQFDHWIALGLLLFVGINMIRSGFNPEKESYVKDPSKGGMLIMLSVATSIDALAVGLSMAMLKSDILAPVASIGIVTFGLSLVGLLLGFKLGEKFGKRMEILGGVILIGIGVRVLISHIF
jgi:manganese efflux pump family protein